MCECECEYFYLLLLMFSYVQQLESLKLLTLRGKIKKRDNFLLLQHFIIQNVLWFFCFFLYLSAINFG